MARRHYNYKNGPDIIQPHSVAKHRILQSYLAAYFQTLATPHRDELSLTLVDGFAGGGHYIHSETREIVKGSPFIFLDAVGEANFKINQTRHKPLCFDVDYFFTEKNRDAYALLAKVLRESEYGDHIGKSIHLRHADFHDEIENIIAFVQRKNPKSGRSIFALDQYGYSEVPTSYIQRIFANLPSAEVILTFGVDSFLTYASDTDLTRKLLQGMGISDIFRDRSLKDIKASDSHWRLLIQSTLYRSLVEECGATYFTPFFIRNGRGHGDYWLIHLSNHPTARDVMVDVHWRNNNYFIHYGGPGLEMFQVGYDPDHDMARFGQDDLGFEFDDVARKASLAALQKQIPPLIHKNDGGVEFSTLFKATCNFSPASAGIYKDALGHLILDKEIEIIGADGAQRRSAQRIKPNDWIVLPKQRSLFLP
jgi:three-Cys-motif partner protein